MAAPRHMALSLSYLSVLMTQKPVTGESLKAFPKHWFFFFLVASSWKSHPIAFAVFYLLELGFSDHPTLKEAYIPGGEIFGGHHRGCQSPFLQQRVTEFLPLVIQQPRGGIKFRAPLVGMLVGEIGYTSTAMSIL